MIHNILSNPFPLKHIHFKLLEVQVVKKNGKNNDEGERHIIPPILFYT